MLKKLVIFAAVLCCMLSSAACGGFKNNGGSGVEFIDGIAVYDLSNPSDVVVNVRIGNKFTKAQINSSTIKNSHIKQNGTKLTIKKEAFSAYSTRSERVLKITNSEDKTAEIPFIVATKIIKTTADFQSINADDISRNGFYVLAADLDFKDMAFTMIGLVTGGPEDENMHPFNGLFEGAGYTVKNINISRDLGDVPASFSAGVFRTVGNAGIVRNLNLLDVTVSARGIAGSLAGVNKGTIENCFTSSTVAAKAYNEPCGGLVGFNSDTGTIDYCISVSKVDGFAFAGGNFGRIRNSFAAVKEGSNLAESGGLYRVGSEPSQLEGFLVTDLFGLNMFGGFFTNSHYKTSGELMSASLYSGFPDVWQIKNNDFPALKKLI